MSHSDALEVATTTDRAGGEWILIGVAIQTEPGAPDPIDALADFSGDIEGLTRTWTGRWVVVGPDSVHSDCAALLACFFRRVDSGEDRGFWISSSVALLAELGEDPLTTAGAELEWAVGLEMYPPPTTRYDEIRRPFSSQYLHIAYGTITPQRRSVPQAVMAGAPIEEVTAAIEARMVTAMRNLARMSAEAPWLALTAGSDSRLVLAAAAAAGIDAITYTQELPFHRMYGADKSLPPKLSSAAGFRHHFIEEGNLIPDRLDLWDAHTGGQSVEIDRVFQAKGMWDPMPDSGFVVRSGVFETARAAEYFLLRPLKLGSPEMLGEIDQWAGYYGRHLNQRESAAMQQWCDWIGGDRDSGLDWRDRFYMEQRVSGWLSSVEQGIDCTGKVSVQFASCRALLDELLSFDVELRESMTRSHHDLLIERMAPELAAFPINPPDPLTRRVGASILREFERAKDADDRRVYLRSLARRLKRW